jgi:psiF repeat
MKKVLATLCMTLLLAGGALAAEKKKTEAKPRTEKSIECSKQADAKKLHGKERKIFRDKCKKGES